MKLSFVLKHADSFILVDTDPYPSASMRCKTVYQTHTYVLYNRVRFGLVLDTIKVDYGSCKIINNSKFHKVKLSLFDFSGCLKRSADSFEIKLDL